MKILIRRIYIRLFSRNKFLRKINKKILHLALSASGYNNFNNMFDSGEEFFIKKYLGDRDIKLCIDIGANTGNYSSLILENTNSKVISFEPLPFVFKKMKKNLSKYSHRCLFINKGVGATDGNLDIFFNKNSSSFASFSKDANKVNYVSNKSKLNIQVVTIDGFCRENNIKEIDLLKIDAEGFEKEVIHGALQTIKKIKPKYIQLEFNIHQLFRNTSLNYFAEILFEYDVYQLKFNDMEKIDPRDPLSNIYLFSNFVFKLKK
tara:strand:+ start:1080 stop:1865 length:786 start_codon:yes stop_codon:yes gene_type:complete